jgi:hypothetical protein
MHADIADLNLFSISWMGWYGESGEIGNSDFLQGSAIKINQTGSGEAAMSLWSIAIIVLLINIPFGYWRDMTEKFSWQWILAIHLPVPMVVALRIFSGLGWQFITFPVLIGAFFLGQILGGNLDQFFNSNR